jgi:hypothetical protein
VVLLGWAAVGRGACVEGCLDSCMASVCKRRDGTCCGLDGFGGPGSADGNLEGGLWFSQHDCPL